jgi:hypothetical protein
MTSRSSEVTNSDSVLKEALAPLRRTLKAKGFSAKGRRFYRTCNTGNTLLVSVQKSMASSSSESLFTINYGVYCARIGSKLAERASAALDVFSAHWRKRIADAGREVWMRVKSTDSADELANAIIRALGPVLTDLDEHGTDEALRTEWLSGRSPGLVNTQRLLFLAILINEIGPPDKLDSVVRELRSIVKGTIHEKLMERRLANAVGQL